MFKKLLNRPVAICMIFIIVIIFGVVSYSKLVVNLLPDIKHPSVTIWTEYQGTAPEEIEKEITTTLEASIGSVNGIKKITSSSKDGISLIKVDFQWGTNMDFAILSLREKLDGAYLPESAGRPNIIRIDPKDKPVMALTVSAYNLYEARNVAENVIKRRLEQIEGVAMADVTGGEEKEIRIQIDTKKLHHNNISIEDIRSAVRSANIEQSGGTIRDDVYIYDLRITSRLINIKDIETIRIKQLSNGRNILLRDLAIIELKDKEKSSFTRYNGTTSVGLLIRKDAGSNTVEVSKKVDELIKVMAEENPQIKIAKAYDQAEFINQSIMGVFSSIWQGGILAFLILIPFLKNFSSPLNIALSIPISVLACFILMHFTNISLNFMSMSGLALGIGMLVDNAIVVLENINRLRDEGKTRLMAALLGTKEVAMPISASTLTTIIVFLPIVFTAGIAGELFKEQAITVTFSLICSLIVSLTLLPVIYANFSNKIISTKTADLSIKSPHSHFFNLGSYWFATLIIAYLITLFLGKNELLVMFIYTIYLSLIMDHKIKGFEYLVMLKKREHKSLLKTLISKPFQKYLLLATISFVLTLILIIPGTCASRIDFFEPINKIAELLKSEMLFEYLLPFLSEISMFIRDIFTPYEESLGTNTFTIIAYSFSALALLLQFGGLLMLFKYSKLLTKQEKIELSELTNLRNLISHLFSKGLRFIGGLLKFWHGVISKLADKVTAPVYRRFDIIIDKFSHHYHNILTLALKHSRMTILFTLSLFAITLFFMIGIEKRLMPSIDSGEFILSVELSPGTSLAKNEEIVRDYENLILADSLTSSVFCQGGTPDEKSKISGSTIYKSEIQVKLIKGVKTADYINQLRGKVEAYNQKRTEDIKVNFNSEVSILSDFLKVDNADLAIKVYGHDLADLEKLANQVVTKLAKMDNLTEVKSSFISSKPKMEILFNQDKLALYNLEASEIEEYLKTLSSGIKVSDFNDFQNKLDIILGRSDEERYSLNNLTNQFYNKDGQLIPLTELITINKTTGPEAVEREKQQRVITVTANISYGSYSTTVAQVEKELADITLYKENKIEVGGQNLEMKDSFKQLILMFLLSIILVYMVLASQFESLLSPLIIIMIVPTALTGASIGLLMFGLSLNIMSVIGMIILIGIAVNDAIVKVEFIDHARKNGATIEEAIFEASVKRLRPILMTTATTVCGMIPMALALGGSSELQVPLAITVIFGLSFSTAFTLFLTPVVYKTLKKETMTKSSQAK